MGTPCKSTPSSPSPPSRRSPSSARARPRCWRCATAWPGGRARRSGRRWATCAGCSACRRRRCWGWAFWIGLRQLAGRGIALAPVDGATAAPRPAPLRLFGEALLTAGTNPKPILFFTALFPQFLDAHAPLLPQFLVLTGLFMALSFASLATYAALASRARALLARPRFTLWLERGVGAIFVAFGAALLGLRRQAA